MAGSEMHPSFPHTHQEIAKLEHVQQMAVGIVDRAPWRFLVVENMEFSFQKGINIYNYLIQNGSLKLVCF